MSSKVAHPFASIESALEFIVLLQGAIAEASDEVRGKLRNASTEGQIKDVKLALFRLHQLSFTVNNTRDILSDLSLLHDRIT